MEEFERTFLEECRARAQTSNAALARASAARDAELARANERDLAWLDADAWGALVEATPELHPSPGASDVAAAPDTWWTLLGNVPTRDLDYVRSYDVSKSAEAPGSVEQEERRGEEAGDDEDEEKEEADVGGEAAECGQEAEKDGDEADGLVLGHIVHDPSAVARMEAARHHRAVEASPIVATEVGEVEVAKVPRRKHWIAAAPSLDAGNASAPRGGSWMPPIRPDIISRAARDVQDLRCAETVAAVAVTGVAAVVAGSDAAVASREDRARREADPDWGGKRTEDDDDE
jgi:hypothetical protein